MHRPRRVGVSKPCRASIGTLTEVGCPLPRGDMRPASPIPTRGAPPTPSVARAADALRASLRRARGRDVRIRLQQRGQLACAWHAVRRGFSLPRAAPDPTPAVRGRGVLRGECASPRFHLACNARHRAPRRLCGRLPPGRDPTPRRPLPPSGGLPVDGRARGAPRARSPARHPTEVARPRAPAQSLHPLRLARPACRCASTARQPAVRPVACHLLRRQARVRPGVASAPTAPRGFQHSARLDLSRLPTDRGPAGAPPEVTVASGTAHSDPRVLATRRAPRRSCLLRGVPPKGSAAAVGTPALPGVRPPHGYRTGNARAHRTRSGGPTRPPRRSVVAAGVRQLPGRPPTLVKRRGLPRAT
jgi:hypothetical protein